MNNSGISFTCDSCGREVFGCNIVNGMKFCAKCYQEIFGNQQNKESSELLVNSLAEKDKQIAELKQQLEEKEKEIEKLRKLHSIRDDASQCEIVNGVKFNAEQIMIMALLNDDLYERIKRLENQLRSQPAEIVEKIKEFVDGNAYYYEEEQYAKQIIKYLDDILKEYQK